MIRQQLEEYLDGALSNEESAQLERRMAGDASMTRMLAHLRTERALRAAVFAQYEPSAAESQRLASSIIDACHEESTAVVGYVWFKRSLAAAAALGVLVGTFALGRFTAPQSDGNTIAAGQAPAEIIRVLYNDESGEPQMKEFTSNDDAVAFFKDVSERHAEPVAIASSFDAEHPGSF